MQTILPYSRDSTSAAMSVDCSCQSCSLLQIPAIPATREKNPQPTHQRLETRKSLPNLLPSWIPLSCCLRRVTITRWTRRQGRHPAGRRTSAAAAIAKKWADAGSWEMRLFITQTARHARSYFLLLLFLRLFSNCSPETCGRAYYVKTKFLHRQGG